ncbi:hypothetical protein BpHYR1_031355 [Brachionus plicatilis]|uniref:Uncharacterized protein n=1 Tax=Brachionus plicatilis TaxID=10195 RepID=A0A3M7S8J5_BRAPC|nr:hypothetical protein BpHYR1_031355 [Brachionus plicatilis]
MLFKNVTLLDTKSKSNYYEKKSQEISEPSEDVQIEIKKVLSGKKNPVECSDSGRFFEDEKSLKMHQSKILIFKKKILVINFYDQSGHQTGID